MSGPNRTFSFNNGDDRHGAVSPISEPDEPPSYQRTTETPGVDNLGPSSVGGGIGGIAMGVANNNNNNNTSPGDGDDGYVGPAERGFNTTGSDNPYVPSPPIGSSDSLRPQDSYGPGLGTAVSDPSQQHLLDPQPKKPYWSGGEFNDGPYQRNSAYSGGDYPLFVNPDEIIDDGDDGISGSRAAPVGAGAAGGAAAGGLFGGLFKSKKAADTTAYGPVAGAGAGGAGGAAALEAGEKGGAGAGGSKKRGWIVGLILGFIVVGAIVGGAVGGILGHRGNTTREKGGIHTATDDKKTNGDLDKHSSEIKSLMSNKDLHKVFPGVDYTPWGVQYPLCLKYPPSQNNVTRDMAVLSQLTNTVRLYGTDCNQTEMVLHAIDRLELKNMKLWLGVWIESNETTTNRQIDQLYKVIDDTEDTSIFKGAIVGNEALFRAGSTKKSAQKNLIGYMNDVKDEFKKRSLDLPVATSDLGDNWNKDLAQEADLVMSNVHPFFAGVTVEEAASWTYTFWTGHDASLTKGTDKKQVISEVGWPSGGGNDCGSGNKCKSDTDGSVASVENMNQFMSDWTRTNENRFEAFDEPWKVQFNTEDEKWEDKWGLMDASRKLKPGLKIPDCGGKEVQ